MERWCQLNTTLLTKLKTPFQPIEGLRPVLSAQRLRTSMQFSPPIVVPKAWFQVSSDSDEIQFWIVILTVPNFSSFDPSPGSNIWRYIEKFSSSPQLVEVW